MLCMLSFHSISCSNDNDPSSEPKNPVQKDMNGFAKGADVSWITEMESNGMRFFDANGTKTECMTLMKKLGMNSIRLRIWVNPSEGWCNKTDLLIKAKRAHDLNMRVMIDFHYSDSWADPGKQTKPAEWKDLSFDDLCTAVSDHTTEVLTTLKNWNITPEWVQVGNETGNGMLWDDGKADTNPLQYTKLNNAGYDAVKAVFPDAKVIVHVQNGWKTSTFTWLFNILENNGGKYDVIGMSLYPEIESWQTYNDNIINNINDMINQYNKEVMICEVGMTWNESQTAYNFLSDLVARSKEIEGCLGVFYWEPQAYNSWKGYQMGAFDDNGKPTKALDAFK